LPGTFIWHNFIISTLLTPQTYTPAILHSTANAQYAQFCAVELHTQKVGNTNLVYTR